MTCVCGGGGWGGEGGSSPHRFLWVVLGLDTFIPFLIPVGTHSLRSTDLGLEPALVSCGTLGKLFDSSELRCFPLKSEVASSHFQWRESDLEQKIYTEPLSQLLEHTQQMLISHHVVLGAF